MSPLCLGAFGIAAGDDDAPVGEVRAGGPDLLAVDDPVVAVAHRARAQAGEVGAGGRLGEELAPDLLARQRLRRVAALLRPRWRRPSWSGCTCRGRSRSSRAARGSATPPALQITCWIGERAAAAVLLRPGDARRSRPRPSCAWKSLARREAVGLADSGLPRLDRRDARVAARRCASSEARASARNAASSRRVSLKSMLPSPRSARLTRSQSSARASSRAISSSFQRRALPSARASSLARR